MSGSSLTDSAADVREWLTKRIAEYLEKEPAEVDAQASFEDQGLDSMAALVLCDDIEHAMGLVVDATVTWDYPTIDELAEYLRTLASDTKATT